MSVSVPSCKRCGAATMWTFRRDPAVKSGKEWILADAPAGDRPKEKVEYNAELHHRHVCPEAAAAPGRSDRSNELLERTVTLLGELVDEVRAMRKDLNR